jgi:hypothetical protein
MMSTNEPNREPDSDPVQISPLLYASAGAPKIRRKFVRSGIISLVAAILQVPWVGVCIFTVMEFRLVDDSQPNVRGSALLVGSFSVPTIIGLACGFHSVRTAKDWRQNPFGLAGLVLSILWALGLGVALIQCVSA